MQNKETGKALKQQKKVRKYTAPRLIRYGTVASATGSNHGGSLWDRRFGQHGQKMGMMGMH